MASEAFQRARRPEQVAERRAAIVAAARDLLTGSRLAEISLRELSAHVGLAKSNVLRYFDSREAIYLELLDQEWSGWLDDVERLRPADGAGHGSYAVEAAIAGALTRTLGRRPMLCELFSSLAAVLEHNIGSATARAFKAKATASADRLQAWIQRELPALSPASARQFAGAATLIAGALWAYERPAPNVEAITQEMGGLAALPFETNLRGALHVNLVGLSALRAIDADAPHRPL